MRRPCYAILVSLAMLGAPGIVNAQLLDDKGLALARKVGGWLQLAEQELNQLGPDWVIPPLKISIVDGVPSSGPMNRYAENVVELHTKLYNLNDAQKSKLLTAALFDVRQFCRRFAHADVAEPQELGLPANAVLRGMSVGLPFSAY